MSDLIVVMAHGAAQEIFDRHLPLWEKYKVPIWIISPIDDPIRSKHEQIHCSLTSHHHDLALARIKIMLWYMERRGPMNGRFIIFEYDSFFTGDKLPATADGLCGNMMISRDVKFLADKYPTPPWIIDSRSLLKMQRAIKFTNGVIHEQGFTDRYLAAIANISDVPMHDYSPKGFVRDTIATFDFPELQQAKDAGAFAYHGIKTKEVLDFILQ